MNEQIDVARRYARMLWRYRWAALALSTVMCFAGWTYVIALPNTYDVNAKVFVDTSSMLRPLLKGLAVDNTILTDSALLMKRTLLTRPNLEEVARRSDLDLGAETPRQFEALVTSLAQRIKLSGTTRDNVYEIQFSDTDAQRAKQVVDELLNTFLETALGKSRTDTEVTQQFLDEQIGEYERRLVEAEERLKTFKQKNVGLMPGTESGYFQRLGLTKVRLEEATLVLNEAIRRRDEFRKQLKEPTNNADGVKNDPNLLAMSSYTERIKGMQSNLDLLQLQYTDKHPDVAGLKEKIADLEAKREVELEELSKQLAESSARPGVAHSEALTTTRLAVAEAEAQAAAMQIRVTEYRKQLDELENLIDTVPEVEAELVRLNRDYGLNQKQFDELIARRESARLSEEVEQNVDDVKLKVIEPPKVPLAPSGPNRMLLFSGVFAAALGAGGALAFLLSQVQPRFYTTEELKEIAQLPILGAVSYKASGRYRMERRMELAVFALIFFLLASVYGGLLTLDGAKVDLHGKFKALVELPA